MHILPGVNCLCGALAEPGKRRCAKCRYRASWRRRGIFHDGL